jgi:glycosyltransferase involved in cell wall biosynthesis
VRVLIAHSFYRTSGGEDACVRQQLDLLRRRHDVFLLEKHNSQLRGGVSTGIRMAYSPRIRADVESAIRLFRPDVIHIHNSYPAFGPAVFLGARNFGIPLVMTVHNYRLRCPNGYMFTEGAICTRCTDGAYHNAVLHPCFSTKEQSIAYASSLWLHRFVLKLESNISMLISPSEFMHASLLRWGIDAARLTTIRNFTRIHADAEVSSGRYGAYVGRLSREKGVHVLLNALSAAGDPPFKIVGDGPEAASLRRAASQLGLRQTQFVGRSSPIQVDLVLRGAKFVVVPSVWNENAPLAALEAMARGRPLIVSSVGGLRELADGGRGWLARPGDAHDLSDKMRSLMENDEMCIRAGGAALAFAREELTPERHLNRLEQTYEGVVA